jgi:hypothetical protein
MRVIHTSLGMLFVVAAQASSYADITKLSAEGRKALQDSARFHEVHATTKLPPLVVKLCADENGRIAEPGQNWQATDVVIDNKLSWKRLIWAATDRESRTKITSDTTSTHTGICTQRRSAMYCAVVCAHNNASSNTVSAAPATPVHEIARWAHPSRCLHQTSRYIPASVKHAAAFIDQIMVIQLIGCPRLTVVISRSFFARG